MIRSVIRSQFSPAPLIAPLGPLIRAVSQACSLDHLEYHAQTAIMALGCDYFALLCPPPAHATVALQPVVSSLPEEGLSDFLKRGLQCSWAELDAALSGCGVVFAIGSSDAAGSQVPDDAIVGGALTRVVSAADQATLLVAYCKGSVPPSCILEPLAIVGAAIAVRLLALHDAGATSTLSDVQAEILRWAAAGKSNGDIATILGISRRGCDYHMGAIYKKLGVSSRSQAVAAYIQGDIERPNFASAQVPVHVRVN